MTGHTLRTLVVLAAGSLLAACAGQAEKSAEAEAPKPTEAAPANPQQAPASPKPDLGIEWVRTSAEYKAEAMQAYNAAAEDLDEMIADKNWSALPSQAESASSNSYSDKPPAMIFDIDETVVDNVEFQAQLVGPFSEAKFDAWHEANDVPAVPGAQAFVERAREAGVEIFFVTNRSCHPPAGSTDPCPQKRITLDDLREAGIPFKPENVLLSDEQPGWTQEKEVRRTAIAARYRVIMLFGDDLGDFLPCVRKRLYEPCTQAATRASRKAAIEKHARYWGEGWYVLPNPMYGSWTSVD
jgi:5'-nucleotidase (lipoprotein e(P4) family)